MAKVHVLETDPVSRRATILIHGNSPNGSNYAGYPFDKAVKEYNTHYASDGSVIPPRSMLPDLEQIDPHMWQQIQTGEVFELVAHVWYDPDMPPAQTQAKMKADAEVRAQIEIDRLAKLLAYWGARLT